MKVTRLDRSELVSIIDGLFNPKDAGATPEELDNQLFVFCLHCPDPRGAYEAVINAPYGITVEQIAERALTMPARSIESWSEEELSRDHPLRKLELAPIL